jgi:hypothetical protein
MGTIPRSGIMRVIYISPNRRSSGMGVSHSVKLTPSGWNSRGQRGIHHNKCVFLIIMEEEG